MMDQPSTVRDARFRNLNYSVGMMGNEGVDEIYVSSPISQLQSHSDSLSNNEPNALRPMSNSSVNLNQSSSNDTLTINMQRGIKRISDECCYDERVHEPQQIVNPQNQCLSLTRESSNDNQEESYISGNQTKKSPPSNGKKTKGRVKIKMEYIDNKLRRYTTFSKRKTGIMKKAYELSTLTGTQVMLLVASETGHVYTFATRKLQPMITSEAGKALIQTCLNSPDPPSSGSSGDQRMSATGFEETELTYNITEDEQKVRQLVYGSSHVNSIHISYPNNVNSSSSHHSSTHSQHAHLLNHSSSPHLVPCSSPNSILTNSPYVQSSSPLTSSHISYNSHMSHTHNQR